MPKRNLLLEVFEVIIICFALSWLLKTYAIGFIEVQEKGMFPTVELGDELIIVKLAYDEPADFRHGDLIAYLGADGHSVIVKRAVGLPGDNIEIRNGYTYINGNPVYERYAQTPVTLLFEPVKVPDGHVFVLNDNRYQQNDSRTDGPIPADRFKGKAVARIWPLTQFKFL